MTVTAALASARAASAAIDALDAEIAGIRALTPRKGRAQARANRIADLLRIRGRRVAELRTALKAACKEMYAALDERGRRLVHAEMRKWYARNKKYPKLHGGISQNCAKIQI